MYSKRDFNNNKINNSKHDFNNYILIIKITMIMIIKVESKSVSKKSIDYRRYSTSSFGLHELKRFLEARFLFDWEFCEISEIFVEHKDSFQEVVEWVT